MTGQPEKPDQADHPTADARVAAVAGIAERTGSPPPPAEAGLFRRVAAAFQVRRKAHYGRRLFAADLARTIPAVDDRSALEAGRWQPVARLRTTG
jgi:hypothetical protein